MTAYINEYEFHKYTYIGLGMCMTLLFPICNAKEDDNQRIE